MSERVDQVRKDNTQKAIRELMDLCVSCTVDRLTDESTRIVGYTRQRSSEIAAAITIIRSRYGYYCAISYTYDPSGMFLMINVKEREYGN